MSKSTPLTSGERRGLLCLLAITLIAITTVAVIRHIRQSDAEKQLEEIERARPTVTVPIDSLAGIDATVKPKKKNNKKTKSKNTKTSQTVRQPDERLFLDEKQ